jgi:hypothetical protein
MDEKLIDACGRHGDDEGGDWCSGNSVPQCRVRRYRALEVIPMASPAPNSPARVPLLQGRTGESILDALREAEHWHHQVSKVVLDREDECRVELAAIRGKEIQKIPAWLLTQPRRPLQRRRHSSDRRLIRKTVVTLSLSGRTVTVWQISVPRMAGHFGAGDNLFPAPASTWAASMVALTLFSEGSRPVSLLRPSRQGGW